jgi:hypothetical protein
MTGRRKKPFGVDELWQLERIGGVSLSPDGAQAVCSVSSYSMADNKSSAKPVAAVDVRRRAAPADVVRREGRPAGVVADRRPIAFGASASSRARRTRRRSST